MIITCLCSAHLLPFVSRLRLYTFIHQLTRMYTKLTYFEKALTYTSYHINFESNLAMVWLVKSVKEVKGNA